MAMYAKVRRMRLREGLSITEIARRTSLSRNTIKAWLRGAVRSEMTYRQPAGPRKIGPHATVLQAALEADARRPRRERRTAGRLYAQLRAQGFAGSYARVTEFIRAWRAAQGAVAARAAYVPLPFASGEAFQFDWSEEGLVIGGVRWQVHVRHARVQGAHLASRLRYRVQMTPDGHRPCLEAIERTGRFGRRCAATRGGRTASAGRSRTPWQRWP